MDYEEAFWLLVDVPNLERRVAEAEKSLAGTDEKVAKAKHHLDAAKAAKAEAKQTLEQAKMDLAAAQAKTENIPVELYAQAIADVQHRNTLRDNVVNASAGLAVGTGEAGGN